MYLDWLQSKDA